MEDSFFKKEDDHNTEIPRLNDLGSERNGGVEEDRDRALIAAILSYIPFLCLIPLIQMRDNPQARFHSKQGLILFLIEIIAALFLIPGVSSLIWKFVIIAALGASLAGIIFGIQGKEYKLPFVGDIADKMKL
ncbi:MAG: hypothetical protein ABIJ45_00605 [Candidatus Zixiibacteriota bacterium]